MAGNIKGITIKFNGDTTRLDKALREVKNSTKDIDKSLSDVNKSLKFNPKNVDLLKQKQELLRQKVDKTKEQLQKLNNVQRQMDASGVDKTSSEYMELRRNIIETESKLKHFNAELQKVRFPRAIVIGRRLDDIGRKARSAGRQMLPLTGAITAFGAAATKITADFDAQMSKVIAISNASGEAVDDLRAKAREMGAKTKFSATEAAQGFEYMAMAGWKTEDMLAGIEGVMNLAAASGEELGLTSDILTDALTAFGLGAKDSAHFADILAAASSNANTNVKMMGETFKYAAPVAGALGLTAEDTALAIGMMANAGIKSSQAGTAIRTGLTNLIKPTKDIAIRMESLGISVKNADGSMKPLDRIIKELRVSFKNLSEAEKAEAAATIFGKNAMSGWLAVINGSESDLDKLTSAISNCDGASKKMAETMNDNLNGQLTIIKSSLQELSISIGEVIMPYVSKLATGIQKLVDKFNSLSAGQKKLVVVIGAIIAAIGPALIIVGGIISAVGKIMIGLNALTGVIGAIKAAVIALKVAILANPIGFIIAGIAALIVGGIALYKKCEWFRNGILKIWDVIKTGASELLKHFKKIFQGILTASMLPILGIIAIGKKLYQNWDVIKAKASSLWGHIKNIFNGIKKAITEPIRAAANFVKKMIEKIKAMFQFKVSLPKIKLPHFGVSPKGWQIGDLLKGTIPSLGIEWYKKGGIFNSPSVIGVGEAGTEAVLPLDKFWGSMDRMSDRIVAGIAGSMSEQPIVIKIGNQTLTSVIVDILRKEVRRT